MATSQIIYGGLSANTFSATTIYGNGSNLLGVSFTGGTVTGSTTFTNTVSADTISATTLYVSGNSITRPYKIYVALLTQTGTSAPIATVLENTIGNIVWNYDTVGGYEGILVGAFPLGKTFMQIGTISNTRGTYIQHNQPMDSVYIEVTDNDGVTNIDNVLYNTSLEIRVYN